VTNAAAEPLTPGDRPRAEPAVRLQRRTPPASRERRPAALVETTRSAIEPSAGPHERRRRAAAAPEPSPTPSTDPCPQEPGASATPSAAPEADPFTAGDEPGGCPGEGERAAFPLPTTSGSPDPPD